MQEFRLLNLMAIGILLLMGQMAGGQQPSATEILQNAVQAQFPENFIATVEMVGTKPDQPDTIIQMKIFRKGSGKGLIEVLAPPEMKGQKILRVGDMTEILFPEICKLVPIPQNRPIFGTTFSATDVLRVDLVKDYNATLVGLEELGGKEAYKLDLQAKDETVPFDRVLYWVEVQMFLPLRGEYFTLSGKLLRTLTYSEPTPLGGAVRNSKLTVEDALVVGAKTTMAIQEMEVKKAEELPDDMFTEEALLNSCSKSG